MSYKGAANIDLRKFFDEGDEAHEPEYCATFGCGKKLTLYERLWGVRCIEHQHEITTLDIVDRYLSE